MLTDLPERNALLAGSQQQTNNYSQEIAHEQNTFERRIYGMTMANLSQMSKENPFEKVIAIQEQNNLCSSCWRLCEI